MATEMARSGGRKFPVRCRNKIVAYARDAEWQARLGEWTAQHCPKRKRKHVTLAWNGARAYIAGAMGGAGCNAALYYHGKEYAPGDRIKGHRLYVRARPLRKTESLACGPTSNFWNRLVDGAKARTRKQTVGAVAARA